MISRRHYPYILALGIGLVYSLLARFVLDEFMPARSSGLLSISFLAVMR